MSYISISQGRSAITPAILYVLPLMELEAQATRNAVFLPGFIDNHSGYQNINNSKVSPLSWLLETRRVSWRVSLKIYLILIYFPWNVIFTFPWARRLSLVDFHLDFCCSCIQVESTTKPILIQNTELCINSTVIHAKWYLLLCYY